MIKLIILSLLLPLNLWAQDIYNFSLKNEKGETLALEQFKDKTLLIVNIATKCGLTGQLDDLEKVYKKYQEKGLVVLGIPSNDFRGQTPENDEEVAKFCRLTYGVSFPLAGKIIVKGEGRHPLYDYLISSNKTLGDQITWNFEKFLIDKKGKTVGRFSPKVKPMDKDLTKMIEEIL